MVKKLYEHKKQFLELELKVFKMIRENQSSFAHSAPDEHHGLANTNKNGPQLLETFQNSPSFVNSAISSSLEFDKADKGLGSFRNSIHEENEGRNSQNLQANQNSLTKNIQNTW